MSHHLEKWLTKKRGLWTEGILPLTHSPSSLVDLNLWRRDSLNLCRDTKVLNDAITRWEVKLLTNYQNHWASLHLPANLWTSKHKIHCCNKLSLFHIHSSNFAYHLIPEGVEKRKFYSHTMTGISDGCNLSFSLNCIAKLDINFRSQKI